MDQKQRLYDLHTSRFADGQGVGLGWRIMAGCVDVGIYGFCTFIWFILVVVFGLGYINFRCEVLYDCKPLEHLAPATTMFNVIASGWLVFAVLGETAMIAMWGRTIGKRGIGVVVVRDLPSVEYVSWFQALVRTTFKASIVYVIGIALPLSLAVYGVMELPIWVVIAGNLILIALTLGAYRRDRRGLHELAARTVLIDG